MATHGKRSRGRPRSEEGGAGQGKVQSLDRAITLLKLVSEGSGLSLTEVSDAAGLAPSTAYRMLTTLQQHGMVEFDEINQLWFVGVETFRMGTTFLRRRKLVERGRTVIQLLMQETGETANLAVADEEAVVFVSQVETHEAIRAFFRPGTRSPYHASGIGKAILAYRAPEQVERLIARCGLEGFTEKTLTSAAALADDLTAVRGRGFAIDDEERNPGMRCVAAPVFNEFEEPIGGVSVSGPSVRVTDARAETYGPRVRAAGQEITQAMGGRWPDADVGAGGSPS
ncbi:HTH-type transcriptional regulator BhcR [Algihabitans albus]|uniref:HTH-type transcriptional regulator BhcR n=1 Tax=Algihabitans albus TaxID=2164067 RepID=UPI000E5D0785|nr:HTH-type transcriptional regulator BhcR [Algihabitans albus]